MASPPPYKSNAHQNMLQAAVQAVNWTYSLFWQLSPEKQRVLVWGDGYYNGAIKTRKTVNSVEVSTEEASLERSQQLRELYDSLSTGDLNNPSRRPAALSPEDLTESEWFYLMCVSFSFPLGVGLPGKAYVKRQHLWLKGANEASSKHFTRAILAKSAGVQTVVCIPLLDGVVELGTTDKVEEKIEFIEQVKSYFINCNNQATHPPKPALSEHSTSNLISPSRLVEMDDDDENDDDNDDDDDAGEEDDDEGDGIDVEAEAARTPTPFGSVDPRNVVGDIEAITAEDELLEEHNHYSQTITTILHNRNFSGRSSGTSSAVYSIHSPQSSFSICTAAATSRSHRHSNRTSQYLLKYILFTVPYLHSKSLDNTAEDSVMLQLKKSASQEELSANHVLAERRRREKLNERFVILRSLVPFVTKMDKASILGDTIEYVKQLRKKIHELEAREHHVNEDADCVDQRLGNRGDSRRDKRKMRVVEQGGRRVVKAAEVQQETTMEVSIIENDGLVEIKCPYKEGLLLDVMMKLREFRMEITAAHSSSSSNGGFVAELRAKVKETVNGKKASITEVKKAMKNIIPSHP
ncbi:basic helix-loop-helix protein A isoform X7 [Daucus carota subsp. sativus]|uniref:basic helix-loop-helix protein A isoform X7 n=1 Tax=Daucus carota subsp. sativus TaxID=79200 RepID=UPI0007F03590|nr:PREDICTED: basic helix-loop-helix protein A isoform X5 [Daucus carota subsp. sativus]